MSQKLDAVGEILCHAAELIDMFGNRHPASAIALVAADQGKASSAWLRLSDACGLDYMDHLAEENIDDLIAAAYWKL